MGIRQSTLFKEDPDISEDSHIDHERLDQETFKEKLLPTSEAPSLDLHSFNVVRLFRVRRESRCAQITHFALNNILAMHIDARRITYICGLLLFLFLGCIP